MIKNNPLCQLLGIDFPLIQAGMVWVSGGKLARAASDAGILGVVGAGSMNPELLRHHLETALESPNKKIAVNLPLLYSKIEEQIEVALDCGVKIFITSAGSPKKYTKFLKDHGCTVIHVTATPTLAKKCEAAGVDAIIAEGVEAGGHNGRDEITTFCLIPEVVKAVKIPVIAAGGIATGSSMLAAMCLGAAGVQMGTRFMMTKESSAHQKYKDLLLSANIEQTAMSMKDLVPVRLYKNQFYSETLAKEKSGATPEELANHLGRGRAKLGMLEGDLDQGELETGQICGHINDLPTVSEAVFKIKTQFSEARNEVTKWALD